MAYRSLPIEAKQPCLTVRRQFAPILQLSSLVSRAFSLNTTVVQFKNKLSSQR